MKFTIVTSCAALLSRVLQDFIPAGPSPGFSLTMGCLTGPSPAQAGAPTTAMNSSRPKLRPAPCGDE